MKYEFLEHTADVKFRAYGKNLDEAFENTILAFSEIVGKGKKIKNKIKKKIELGGDDRKNLLYCFLDELVYLIDAECFVVSSGTVRIKGNVLKAELEGDDSSDYKHLASVKAATYSEMEVEEKKGKVVIQAVMDI
jgi:SHS2 domain-containing protein